jgi:hypothetical protein
MSIDLNEGDDPAFPQDRCGNADIGKMRDAPSLVRVIPDEEIPLSDIFGESLQDGPDIGCRGNGGDSPAAPVKDGGTVIMLLSNDSGARRSLHLQLHLLAGGLYGSFYDFEQNGVDP